MEENKENQINEIAEFGPRPVITIRCLSAVPAELEQLLAQIAEEEAQKGE